MTPVCWRCFSRPSALPPALLRRACDMCSSDRYVTPRSRGKIDDSFLLQMPARCYRIFGGIISARVSSDEDVLRMRATTETTGRLPITFICIFRGGDRYSNVECNPSIYRYIPTISILEGCSVSRECRYPEHPDRFLAFIQIFLLDKNEFF